MKNLTAITLALAILCASYIIAAYIIAALPIFVCTTVATVMLGSVIVIAVKRLIEIARFERQA